MSPRAGPDADVASDRAGPDADVDVGSAAGLGSTILRRGPGPRDDPYSSSILPVVHEFTGAWERGEAPRLEDYLSRLEPDDEQGAVDLIYRAFCLAESGGAAPVADAYVARFPRYAGPLQSLFRVHGACSPSLLGRLLGPSSSFDDEGDYDGEGEGLDSRGWGLPEAGDRIGPYRLRRELGRGGFARVFLAEQVDLSDRLVVVKIATRSTREPWLMARARHAHIVEILSHAEVDDGELQLIAMPFWGGATLASVLGEASRRWGPGSGRRGPSTGADLLSALDAVGAPEYPSAMPARPAREVLAPLSYARAISWVVARLSEALDHADGRGVAHGDVKPSNVLLSADGSPMLLDFNLARDAAPAVDASGRAVDPGGTLAYMAPERLRALASACSGPAAGEGAGSAVGDRPELARSAHLADVYSMGMVLLEGLTGRPPVGPAPGAAGGRGAARLASQATAYAEGRERPAAAIVAETEAATGRRVPPALRAILGRCLDPDPARRYRRAMELAEDLDRWRTDRPLAYADEPFWGQAVPRWIRVRRRRLAIAAAWLVAAGLGAVAVGQLASNRMLVGERIAAAIGALAVRWDTPDSPAFLGNNRYSSPHVWSPDDPRAFEAARQALMDYGVIAPTGAGDPGDWRARDDVRSLPPADRDDLEVWLMERAYRYARALADRPGAVADWRRAAEALDRAAGPRSIAAFAGLREELASRPGAGPKATSVPAAAAAAPAWLEEHLLGFVAECRPGGPAGLEPEAEGRAVERALGYYARALAIRPGSFWGHYRAASACFGLGRDEEAARHLEQCLARRPENAAVLDQLAGRLVELDRYTEALEYCDRGLHRTPRFAELYRTRVFARLKSGRIGGIDDDLRDFEDLSRVMPASWWGGGRGLGRDPSATTGEGEPGGLAVARIPGPGAGPVFEAARPAPAAPEEEIGTRFLLAYKLREAGRPELAMEELDKALVIDPGHLASRILRAQLEMEGGRFEGARDDLAAAFRRRNRLEARIHGDPVWLKPLFICARGFLRANRPDDARWIVEEARDMARHLGRNVGLAYYHSAEVYAVLGASDPVALDQAVGHLYRAAVANPEFLRWYRDPSPYFDPVRDRIDRELARREDPAAVNRRLDRNRFAGR